MVDIARNTESFAVPPFIGYFARAKDGGKDNSPFLSIPFTELHWPEVPDRPDEQTLPRIQRSLADAQFTGLRQQVYVVATAIRKDIVIDIPDVELSNLRDLSRNARILQSHNHSQVGRSFSRAGFCVNSNNLLASLPINRTEVLAGISVPEISLEQPGFQEPNEAPGSAVRPVRRRARILAPIELAVSLKAYIDRMNDTCPLCGHRDHKESSEDKKRQKGKFCHFN
jgi:hypothetical protein